jgi:hypothetical protein
MNPSQTLDAFGILSFSVGSTILGLALLLVSRFLKQRKSVVAAFLVLIGLGLGSPLAWAQWQERQIADQDPNASLFAQLDGTWNSQASLVALTDRGRTIPLSELHADIDVAGWTQAEDRSFAAMDTLHHLVRSALPDPTCNCHGWVFAEGRFWVDGSDVKNILDDNGYYEVDSPTVGDIIVYHAEEEILHTGIVRTLDANGAIVIESKWGMNSRILHAPEDQPHWQHWQFYHTSRPGGHGLRMTDEVGAN